MTESGMKWRIGIWVAIAFLIRYSGIDFYHLVAYDGASYLRFFEWPGPFPPGYPLMVEFISWITQADQVFIARMVSVISGSLLILPLYLLLSLLTDDDLIVMIMTALVVLHAEFIVTSVRELSDMLYLLFFVSSLYYIVRDSITYDYRRALWTALCAYLIRPEGLLLVPVIFWYHRKDAAREIVLTTLVVIAGYTAFHWIAFDEWIFLTAKSDNFKMFRIDDWRFNEAQAGVDVSWENVFVNTVQDYPLRLQRLTVMILQVAGWPLMLLGVVGLASLAMRDPLIPGIFAAQFFLTPLSGANMDYRYGIPYVIGFMFGVMWLIYETPRWMQVPAVIACVVGSLYMGSGAFERDWPEEMFIEEKTVARGFIPPGSRLMDRKPYTAFYSGSTFVQIPYGDIDTVVKKMEEEKCDYLIIHKGTVSFRPNLEYLASGDAVEIYQRYNLAEVCNSIAEGGTIRVFKLRKTAKASIF